MNNIVGRFIETAKNHPDVIAIVDGDKKITYKQLLLEVKKCAFQLQKEGLKKGDSMIIFIPMGIDLYRTVLACFYIGAIAVFVDEWVSLKRLELCCQIANCKGFAGTWKAQFLRLISKEIRNISVNFKFKNAKEQITDPLFVNPDDTALITFTTGSTGIPKAANRTHEFLKAQLNILIDELEPQPAEISMPLLPIVLLINLSCGTTSIIAPFKANKPKKLNVEKILAQIDKHKVNTFISSPFVLLQISKKILKSFPETQHLPKSIYTGGAPVFPSEAACINKAFNKNKTTVFYGSTESEPISKINTIELEKTTTIQMEKGLPVGQIHSKTRTLILDINCNNNQFNCLEDLKLNCVNGEEIGEIIVSGPHVLKHYINNPEAEKANKINVNGIVWHRTGDSGYKNKNNDLFLTGRTKQIISSDNYTLYPFIEEYRLKQIEGVNLGTILAIKNQFIIVIELVKGFNKPDLIIELKQIYHFAKPKIIFQEIPRDQRHLSKIDYGKLEKIIN